MAEGGTGLASRAQEKPVLVDTDRFNYGMGCVVVLNVIVIGFETDINDDTIAFFSLLTNGFLIIYIVELMTRMFNHGFKALQDPFTCMDFVLVLLSSMERVVAMRGLGRALPTFRMLRTLKLLKKTPYLQHSKEFRAIIESSLKMLKTLMWAMIFLFMCLWILATFAHIAIGQSAKWNGTTDPKKTFPAFQAFDLREYFGTQWRSFVTLGQVVTLSQWAPHVARPVVKAYPISFLFFVLLLFVTTYGLLTTIVSNLVQESMRSAVMAEKALKDSLFEKRKTVGHKALDILAEVDADRSGELSEAEIAYALQETDLPDILADLGMPVLGAGDLVRLLDYSGDGQVSYEELVNGIVRMDDELTSRDYAMLAFWMKSLLNRTQHLEERLEKLCAQVSFIRQRLAGSFEALTNLIRTAKDTQLRARAIHIIRTTGPPLPLDLEKKKVIVKGIPPGKDPSEEFIGYAQRILGDGPAKKKEARASRQESPDEHSSPEPPRNMALFHNTMPPAPPPVATAKRQTIKDLGRWAQDKYGVVDAHRENPNLTALKRLMH